MDGGRSRIGVSDILASPVNKVPAFIGRSGGNGSVGAAGVIAAAGDRATLWWAGFYREGILVSGEVSCYCLIAINVDGCWVFSSAEVATPAGEVPALICWDSLNCDIGAAIIGTAIGNRATLRRVSISCQGIAWH